ncbi:MAG: outer membrane beta-barrel protein [Bacteroidetes bacterium]|nr:outer membrane beta-barrel protein [Bacteroidota bacterium]
MKPVITLIALLIVFQAAIFAQDGFNTGAHISTSFQLNSHRNKGTKIWSSESGYGFSAGVPFRFGYAEERAFVTGVDYEYMAFDNWANNSLVSSMRLHSVHIPLQLNFDLVANWFISAGTGMNYLFRSRIFTPGSNVSIAGSINAIQPYLSLGIGSISSRGGGLFELGAQARYHFLDAWKKTYPLHEVTTSNFISLDLVMRFYL